MLKSNTWMPLRISLNFTIIEIWIGIDSRFHSADTSSSQTNAGNLIWNVSVRCTVRVNLSSESDFLQSEQWRLDKDWHDERETVWHHQVADEIINLKRDFHFKRTSDKTDIVQIDILNKTSFTFSLIILWTRCASAIIPYYKNPKHLNK